MSGKFEQVSSSAAGAISPAGYHARDRGATQPAQHDQELRFRQLYRAGPRIQQCLICKQPPRPDGCLVAVRAHQAVFC